MSDHESNPYNWADVPERRQTVIGRVVSDWCRTNRVSQTKLAEQLECDHTYISRIVNGERIPAREMAARMAEVMDVPLPDMALMLFDIDPDTIRQEISEELRPAMRREALLSLMTETERQVFTMDRKPPFHELVKQLEKGEIDLDSFILTADEMGVSRFVVEAVVARGEKEAA